MPEAAPGILPFPAIGRDFPRTCVVGAGSSGLVAAKMLLERGVPFDCYELGSDIGGIWRYENDSGLSPAYESLHINTSRQKMNFADFPMPRDYPDFPHHTQILQYLEDYADHFGVRQAIQFNTRVSHIAPTPDGMWDVTTQHGRGGPSRTDRYAAVVVANGHHSKSRIPAFDGEFSNPVIHSSQYRTPDAMRGERVLVVGMGNSGCDIACDLTRTAGRVFLSTRRGAHIIPKYLFGKPLDRLAPSWMWKYLPFRVFQRAFEIALRISRGKLKRFGLPEPAHRILEEHPTISGDLLNHIGHGRIAVKPNVSRFEGERVAFEDGSVEQIDRIILATGYDISFPFLDSEILKTEGNDVRLYRHVVHPEFHNLYFVGLVQPWGSIMPLAEEQSRWVADLLDGTCGLPSESQMQASIDRQTDSVRRRYTKSARHTIQVDFYAYRDELRKERKRGRRRAPIEFPVAQQHAHRRAA